PRRPPARPGSCPHPSLRRQASWRPAGRFQARLQPPARLRPAGPFPRRFLLSCGRSPRGSEPRMKPRLKCDLDDLAFACEDANTEAANYLDLETGEVIRVSDEIRRELERLYEELDGVEDEDQSAFAAALRRRALPDWMKEAIREADRVEAGYSARYVRVPTLESYEGYQIMEDFVATVGERR